MTAAAYLSGVERLFGADEFVVTKTDLKGRITYANRTFLRVAGYDEREVIGAPHNIVRHPGMPRCVFKLLWDTLDSGQEIFAYVLNRARNGDHYWVFAHVTPSFDDEGKVVAYHSNRRVARREAIDKVWDIYRSLLAEEERHENRKEGVNASHAAIVDLLKKNKVSYDEFVLSL